MPSLASQIIEENYTRAQALSRLGKEKAAKEAEVFSGQADKPRDVDFGKEFDQAQKEITEVDELVIFSAGPLSDDMISNLGRKVRNLFGKEIFIDLKVDSNLIGGAALVWKGQYRDYSLRARLEEKKTDLKNIYDQFINDRGGRIRSNR